MKGNLYCYCENNPVVCFDSSGNELEVLDAFVDDYTKVFEMYNGKPTPINYGIQPGTYCRIINDWNKDLVYVEYYHNCSWQKGYIQKKYLDYSGSYRSDSGENVFGFLGNNSGGTKCYHESSYGRDVLMLNICLNKYFDAIVGALEPYGKLEYKPNPAMMNALLAHMNIKPEHTIYIGDADIDVLFAEASGVRPVGITKGNFTHEDFHLLGVWKSIDSLSELIDIANEDSKN